jgi:uncharacterized delta-60 repeat protein
MLRLGASAVRHASKSVAVLLAAAILTSSSVWKPVQAAAAGDLDPAFDFDGKVSTDFFGDADSALDMVIQPDGRIVVAGSARNAGSNVDFALARYNRDGSLDASFGTAGKVTTDFLNIFDQANALALQPDGKIVAAGISRDQMDRADFALARYNSDGSLDASFGRGGKVVAGFAGAGAARGIAIQSDGRIVAAGASFVGMIGDFALVRYNTDGSLDASFGVGGKVTTDFFGFSDGANAVRLLPDGRIIAAGSSFRSSTLVDFALARYKSDGSLDPSFGAGGKVTTDFFGFSDSASALVVQPDGLVVAAGGANNLNITGTDFALARYNGDGSLDASFGDRGKTTTDFLGILDAAADVALQSDGRIVAVGFASNDLSGLLVDFALSRYDKNGRLDTGFGSGGKVITDFFGDRDVANAVAIQADGQLVVAGTAFNGSVFNGSTNSDFALARYAAITEPDYTLAIDPEPVNVARGQKIKVKVNVNRTEGFAGNVTITAPDAEGLTIVMTPESASTSGDVIKFRLKIKGSTPTGTHQIVFIGRDALGRERTSTLTLEIQ